jgi:hypothetical protein
MKLPGDRAASENREPEALPTRCTSSIRAKLPHGKWEGKASFFLNNILFLFFSHFFPIFFPSTSFQPEMESYT